MIEAEKEKRLTYPVCAPAALMAEAQPMVAATERGIPLT